MQYNRDIASEGKRTLKVRIKPLKAACSNKDFSDVYSWRRTWRGQFDNIHFNKLLFQTRFNIKEKIDFFSLIFLHVLIECCLQ